MRSGARRKSSIKMGSKSMPCPVEARIPGFRRRRPGKTRGGVRKNANGGKRAEARRAVSGRAAGTPRRPCGNRRRLRSMPLDLLDRVHDGRVVLVVEKSPDLRVRELGQLPAEVHRDLPGKGDRLGVGLGLHVRDPQAVVRGHGLQDLRGNRPVFLGSDDVLAGSPGPARPKGGLPVREEKAMTRFNRPSSSRTLDFDRAGDEEGHVVGDLRSSPRPPSCG